MRKMLAMAAVAAAFVASPAMATDFSFSFENSYQPYETIYGTIQGLSGNGADQAATAILVSGLPGQTGSFDVTTWASGANSFNVTSGVIDASTSLISFIGPDGSFFLGNPSVGNGTAARFDMTVNGTYQYAATGSYPSYQPVFTSTGPGGVPEPATWAMMLVGFGGMGLAMRRKRITQAFEPIA